MLISRVTASESSDFTFPIMIRPFLCLLFLWILDISLAKKVPRASGVIPIARCRAGCLGQFMQDEQNDNECQNNTQCKLCWVFCDTLFTNYEVYGEVCKKKIICKKGCQTACRFRDTFPTFPKGSVTGAWKFPDQPAILLGTAMESAFMAWNIPVPKNAIPGIQDARDQFLVYVLLAREQTARAGNKPWEQTLQTALTVASLDLGDLPYAPEFWLLAVNVNGTLAQKRFNSTYAELKPNEPDTIPGDTYGSLGTKPVVMYGLSSTLNITMNMSVVAGMVIPVITWKHPPVPANRGDQYGYRVDIFFEDCKCHLPSDHFGLMEYVNDTQEPQMNLTNIVFNANYKVEITLSSDDKWKGSLSFVTPECSEFSSPDYTVCKDADLAIPELKIVNRPSPVPSTTPSWGLIPDDNTELPISDSESPSTVTPTVKNSDNRVGKSGSRVLDPTGSDRLPIDMNITFLSKTYDRASQHVFVNLTWFPPVGTPVRQKVLCYHLNETNPLGPLDVDHSTVNSQFARLTLKPDRTYTVLVRAWYSKKDGSEVVIESKMKYINTDHVESLPQYQPTNLARQTQEQEILNGIILGVTVVSGIIIFGIIVLFIYKKRQKFRDIIITKTEVAKSNSYKSNVGCKGDYSNQMLMSSDDWELDCRQLKFASPIGQGAFGKVVTGYYQDQRVAIKLIRDCAPLSYKEDLLAEIHLMKRLGSHPNIVTMIGACTLAEPIALVMEYLPFGNLQNFLKRCRVDGELTVQAGRCPELNYSIMDDHGGINEGVIRPADMLSFARQVAMAMEYLGDKKYVHRDLAARNVLLGYDKVIKVCDFGLSRDIYNDNQYKKLTNGKLPLKWMAIESLRDRVFTTQSDVWSFGILLWEIVTMGASPYPSIALADLYYVLSNHYRMEKPSNCSDELYIIMRQCWLENPKDRPDFTDLRVHLEMLLSRDRNYLELDNINVPLSTPESSSGSPVSDDTASLLAAQALQTRKSSKDELTVNICVHDKSVERLLKRKAEFAPHDITIL